MIEDWCERSLIVYYNISAICYVYLHPHSSATKKVGQLSERSTFEGSCFTISPTPLLVSPNHNRTTTLCLRAQKALLDILPHPVALHGVPLDRRAVLQLLPIAADHRNDIRCFWLRGTGLALQRHVLQVPHAELVVADRAGDVARGLGLEGSVGVAGLLGRGLGGYPGDEFALV